MMATLERYASLMRATRGGPSEGLDAHVIASALTLVLAEGKDDGAALADAWGLEPARLAGYLSEVFPALSEVFARLAAVEVQVTWGRDEIVLCDLLTPASSGSSVASLLAAIVVRRILRPRPLWRELGLRSEHELSVLMERHFASVAARNVHGQEWKAFLLETATRAANDAALRCTG